MSTSGSSRSRRMMAAVVLGTALSAFGADRAAAEGSLRDIGRYCTSCWRNARVPFDSWGDCTQEVFTRLLERVPTSRWDLALRVDGEERREFLRAIDTVKKRVQRTRRYSDGVDGAADPRTEGAERLAELRETVFHAAEQHLSARQQRILRLTLEGHSVHEIAEQLALPVERISDEKYKAVRKLRQELASRE